MENISGLDQETGEGVNGLVHEDGPKNLREAGPVDQARLNQ